MNFITDKNGKILRVGDMVHDDWGYDLIVQREENGDGYNGKLVCDENDSCANIPYCLVSEEITFVKHTNLN